MSEEINLFILEDNRKQLNIYKDAVEAFQEAHNIQIKITTSENLDHALQVLKENDFDAAILDLKLSGDDTEAQGNQVIKEIRGALRFPIFVLSGFIDDLDSDLRTTSIFYQTFKRTEVTTEEVLNQILKIYKSGITKILGKRGRIEVALHDVFWKHFAENKAFWDEDFITSEDCEKIFLRHILECLIGYLEAECEEGLNYHHPVEVYIHPPTRKKIFTGDILQYQSDSKLYIVLTPPCDLIQVKAKEVVLGYIENPDMDYVQNQKRIIESESQSGVSDDVDKAKTILKQLVTNQNSLKYHYLPKCKTFRGGFINFQKINSVKYSELIKTYSVVASISDAYVKDIIARFSHYYSRQGQPDFDVEQLVQGLLSQ